MKKYYLYILLLLFVSNRLFAQHNPSSYYATNPNSQYGTAGTITINGTLADWSNAKLIAQGVANDDPRIFKGSHEGPVYDLYALYASWDATNLYLMWQYSNVTDVSDPAQGFPISDNGKPWNGNIPICIALDIDPNLQTDGLIDGTTNSVWANGKFNTFANGTDHLLMFSSKPNVGQPALFKMNANGKFDYTTTYAIPFTTAGITYMYGDACLPSTLYGINSNGGSGFVPANLATGTYIDFKANANHTATQETFYEMKIPLAALGITQSYLENNGIGAMVISTFGQSAIESLPHDNATLDNATLAYSADASTSKEKEDEDNFTAPMARIGHAFVACGVTEIPAITPATTSILIGNSTTLTASGCGATQTYKWDSGQTTAAITVSPTTTTSYKAKCVGTCEGAYSAATTVTVTCTAPTEVPSITPTSGSINVGSTISLTASGCGATQTYKWNSGQTTAAITVSPSSTTSYNVKCVSSTGCEGTTSANATVTVTGGASCSTFTWDNATVYFLLIDRFNNGSTANDAAYGRQSDPAGGFMGGDFKGITQKITDGYFDNLGVNALWVTAPYEQMHGYVAGYGSDPAFQKHYAYHGYYPLDFTQPDAAYGTKNEFKAMVDSAHAHGIRIMMDIVMNHLAYDNQGDVNEYLGGFSSADATNAGWCNWWGSSWIRKANGYCATAPGGDDLTMSLAGLPDVKTEVTTGAASTTAGLPPLLQTKWGATKENRLSAEVASLDAYFTSTGKPKTPRHYIIKWLTDWVKDYGVDAFRIDTYKHVGRDAWGELNDAADVALAQWKAANPTKKLDDKPFWSVGEWWGHGIGKNSEAVTTGKTDALINFNFKGVAGSPTALEGTYSSYASTLNPDPTWNALSYISSHDDGMFDRNDLMDAGTSLLLAPGAVQIYYGDETARPLGTVASGTDQPTRSFMNWNSINTNVLTHWQKLGKFRKAHPAIGAGSHAQIAASPYTFSRSITSNEVCGGCDKVVVVIGASGSTTVSVGSMFTNGTLLKDAYTGNTATVSGGNVTFSAGSNGVILIENPAGCVTCTPPTEIPTVAANPTTIEYGQSTTITASGCAAGQTYEWETGQTTASISVSPTSSPTTYKAKCVGTDGCKGSLSAAASVTVNNIPALTVYFKRPTAWTVVPKIYAWTGASTAQTAAWPGTAMTLHCGNWYKHTFAAGVTNVNMVFNDGTGTVLGTNKTADITGVSADSRYDGTVSMTATTMTAGTPTDCPCTPPSQIPTVVVNPTSINVGESSTLTASGCGAGQTYKWETGQTTASITVSPATTTIYKAKCVAADACEGNLSAGTTVTVNGGASNEAKVYFKLPTTWTAGAPKIHYWNVTPTNAAAPNTTWSGLAMVSEGNSWYSYTFPSGTTSANIIFNNSGSPQTNDLTISTFPAWFMSDCAGTVNGKFGTNGNWVFSDPRTTQTGSYDVFLNNTASWATPFAYVFPAGGSGTPAWPGTAMTLVSGSTYKLTLTSSPVCIIFSNNGATQTANLSTSNPGGTWSNGTNTWTPNCIPPAAPTVSASPSSIVSGATSTLTASGCSGTVSWFDVATGGTALATGATYTTSALTANKTYYAECASAANCVSATRGSATITVATCGSTNINLVSTVNDISTGTVKHETDGAITATNKIIGTSINAKYDAKKSITLDAGFEIRATGANVFQAYIDGCGNN